MREVAVNLVRQLRAAGHTAYLAGGCVRDMVRGFAPQDFDIATSATPEEVQRLFPKTVPVGAQFGVVLVIEAGHQFEVATFRNDEAYVDGRRPTGVRFGSPEEDAQRRDFTINGMYYDPVAEKLLDFVGGREDLARQLVRTIGEPRLRFTEDKLRLLRAVRFAANLDFAIEPATLATIREMAGEIKVVSAERIREELIKLFTRPHAGRGLELLDTTGLLPMILPEVAAMRGVEQPPEFHPEGDVFTHVKLMLDEMGKSLVGRAVSARREEPITNAARSESAPYQDPVTLAFAVLLHDVGKPPTFERAPDRIRFNEHDKVGAAMAETILRRLRFSNDEIERIVLCIAEHMRFQHVQEMRPSKLKRILARPTFPVELELHRIDCAASHRKFDNYEFLKTKAAELPPEVVKPTPLVTGHDLLALGLKSGPLLGQILREVEEQQLDDRLPSRETALAFARQRIAELT
jgi:poly(A) polymerase